MRELHVIGFCSHLQRPSRKVTDCLHSRSHLHRHSWVSTGNETLACDKAASPAFYTEQLYTQILPLHCTAITVCVPRNLYCQPASLSASRSHPRSADSRQLSVPHTRTGWTTKIVVSPWMVLPRGTVCHLSFGHDILLDIDRLQYCHTAR